MNEPLFTANLYTYKHNLPYIDQKKKNINFYATGNFIFRPIAQYIGNY